MRMLFQGFREKRELKRKIEWGEILDVSTVMQNIHKLEKEAITSKVSKSGKQHHLLVLRGNLVSDSSIPSSFDKKEQFLIKVLIFYQEELRTYPINYFRKRFHSYDRIIRTEIHTPYYLRDVRPMLKENRLHILELDTEKLQELAVFIGKKDFMYPANSFDGFVHQ